MSLSWNWRDFAALDTAELYAVLQLRQAVFVVEQNCPFLDADDRDADAVHLLGRDAEGRLRAYLRVHASGRRQPEAVISRVVTAPAVRRRGYGYALMSRAIDWLQAREPQATVWLDAQQRLERFYAPFGFAVCTEPFLEDDIWHVGMQAPAGALRRVDAA